MSKQIMGFHYTLNDTDGQLLDTSEGQPPLLFMLESQQIIPGLESQIKDMEVGEKQQVSVKAAEAYGEVNEQLKTVASRNQFPEEADVVVGAQFAAGDQHNPQVFIITAIEGDNVHIDGNHPLAGKDLVFDIEITEKRAATEDELAHGHAHADGSCGHNH